MSELQNKANLKSKIKITSNFSDTTTTTTTGSSSNNSSSDSDMLASLSVEKAGNKSFDFLYAKVMFICI